MNNKTQNEYSTSIRSLIKDVGLTINQAAGFMGNVKAYGFLNVEDAVRNLIHNPNASMKDFKEWVMKNKPNVFKMLQEASSIEESTDIVFRGLFESNEDKMISKNVINMCMSETGYREEIEKREKQAKDVLDKIKKYQNGGSIDKERNDFVERVINTNKSNGVQRLLSGNKKLIQNWSNPSQVSSHKYGWGEVDGKIIIYPEIQEEKEPESNLYDFTNPFHNEDKFNSLKNAIETRDTIEAPNAEIAEWFTNDNYKNYFESTKKYTNNGNILSKKIMKMLWKKKN